MPKLSEIASNLQLLYDASRALATQRDAGEALQEIVGLLVERYGAQWASIQIRLAPDRAIEAEGGERKSDTGLNWQRAIEGNGCSSQLRVQFPAVTPASASMEPFLRLILHQLANLSTTQLLKDAQNAMNQQLREVSKALKEQKLVTRASGILSARQKLSESEARALLDREARRLGLSPAAFATRIIEPAAGRALRKIA